jgi:hypothetical protein
VNVERHPFVDIVRFLNCWPKWYFVEGELDSFTSQECEEEIISSQLLDNLQAQTLVVH